MALPIRDARRTRRTPWITYALLVVNIVVFLFVQPPWFQNGSEDGWGGFAAEAEATEFVYRYGAIPCEVRAGESLAEGAHCPGDHEGGEVAPEDKSVWFSLLSSMFLHGNLAHLAGNMLFLWVFGKAVEDRLGSLVFLALYLVGGLVADLGHIVFNLDDAVPVVGASGAISAVMGAFLVLRPRADILTVVFSAALQVVYVPAWVLLGLFFVTQFFTPDADQVAWIAHAAGMAAGAAMAVPLARAFPDPGPPRRWSEARTVATAH